MLKKRKKIWLLLFLFLLCPLALAGTWLGINLWPREMEPLLWTEKDLDLPEDKNQNGYYFFLSLRENEKLKKFQIKDELYGLLSPELSEKEFFLLKLHEFKTPLNQFLQEEQDILQIYQQVLDYPQFVNQDSLDPSGKTMPVITFLDLHKLGLLWIYQNMLENHPEQAVKIWLKMFKLDQASLYSARTLVSHMVSLSNLAKDLKLMAYIQNYLQASEREEIIHSLTDFDVEKISLRRSLLSEYLYLHNSEYLIKKEAHPNSWFGFLYNPSLFRRDLNQKFRKLDSLIQNPDQITEEKIKKENEYYQNLRKGWFWWLYNPLGKIFQSLTATDLLKYIKEFYDQKAELQKNKSTLLAELKGLENSPAQSLPATPASMPESEPIIKATNNPLPFIPPPDSFSLADEIKKQIPVLQIQISRKKIDEALKDMDHLFTTARAIPFKPQGIRFLSIQAGSFLEQVGFFPNDILLAVNGVELNLSTALDFLLTQKNSKTMEFFLYREGKFLKIRLTIR